MQAHLFYRQKNKTERTIPLILVTQSQWQSGEISEEDRLYLNHARFSAGPCERGLVYHQDGTLKVAYLGCSEGDDWQVLAQAATLLPADYTYEPQQSLSHFALLSWSLAQYRYDDYKKEPINPRILTLKMEQWRDVLVEAETVFFIRNLINMPANDLGPKELAQITERLANQYHAQFNQYVGESLLKENFPAIHAVGRASKDEPRLLCLTWGKPCHPKVTLVGKGVCFDSGGLDIKPANYMRLMKKDMGGAAQVLGLARWIMEIKLPIRLQVLIPAVENAVSSNAFRPGDVLVMRNGLSVEIDNTDAEGRLVLADALVKACEEEPELLMDFSTLTGAARVAMGTEIAALFTPDEQLALDLQHFGEITHDPIWRLPLYAPYQSMLSSTVADLLNSSPSTYAGAITAALFLQRFVSPKTSWAHFDIMAWNLTTKPGKPEGGEAMALRAALYYLLQRYPLTS